MTPEQKRAQIDKLRELADPQFNLSIPDGAKRAITLVADALEATPNTPDRGELAKLLAEKSVDACLTGLLDEEAVGLADAILAAYPAVSRAAVPEATEPEWEYSVGHRNSKGGYSADADMDEDELCTSLIEVQERVVEAVESGTYANALPLRRRQRVWLPVPERGEE
ncbi:hypothetical protein G7068_16030 [Leucobacter viscericola]|uniref:Uncharacterized protein n=1 Tax=Leucobacter viscericola TaxID=2714935 RepID=A0A6G7XJ07_9MICO|nr:hypothetical protein [Leucobacter viscericola]QIK64555.1 hypothetical protein G7068_16030 [Leucobacter viscericola]